jgi:hypothetical protein
MLRSADYRCERCGSPGDARSLEVHHLTYERLGRELPEDLMVVCWPCHDIEDAERANGSSRVVQWAATVFGPGWRDTYGERRAEELFRLWVANGGIVDGDPDGEAARAFLGLPHWNRYG